MALRPQTRQYFESQPDPVGLFFFRLHEVTSIGGVWYFRPGVLLCGRGLTHSNTPGRKVHILVVGESSLANNQSARYSAGCITMREGAHA